MVPAFAVAAAFTGVGITLGTLGLAIATIVINLAIAAVLGKLLAPDVPKTGRDTKGLQTTIRSNIAPRRVAYGECAAGGPYVVLETIGEINELLNMVIVITGHPIEDVLGVFIDDEYVDISGPVTDTGTNDLSSSYFVNSGKYGTGAAVDHVKIIKNLGWGFADHQYVIDETDALPAKDRTRGGLIAAELDSIWTQPTVGTRDSGTGLYGSGYKLTNCAHIFLSFRFNRDVWAGFPKVKFHIKGKRLYNPRLDATQPGGSGPHRLTDPDTWEHSEDWSLCCLDYLLNTSYGLGARTTGTLTEINWSEFVTAYNDSSEVIDNGLDSPNQANVPRYTVNGIFETSATPISNMEALLTSGAGQLIYAQGEYNLRAGVYKAPSSDNDIINEDMIISPLSIQTHTPRGSVFNKGAGVFVNIGYDKDFAPSNTNKPLFEPTDFAIVDPLDSSGNNPFEIIDGEEIIREFDYPFTIHEYEAQRLTRIQLERVRQGLTVSFEADLKALKYSVGDNVYLEILNDSKYTNEAFFNRLGFDDAVQDRPNTPFTPYYKQFKIISMDYTENFTIQIVMVEESEEIYEFNAGQANLTDHELGHNIPVSDPTGVILPPSWIVASPEQNIVETVTGTDIQTKIRWTAPVKSSAGSEDLDKVHISSYALEFGIVTDPSQTDPADRVAEWSQGGVFIVNNGALTTQGILSLTNIYIDPVTDYDFRLRSFIFNGRGSPWAYYSVDIGSDFSPTLPVGAIRYYIKEVNGVAIEEGIGSLTLEAREVTSAADILLSTGTIQLYVGSTLVTVANGFASPSDGYTGTFDSTDINITVQVELKDGPAGDIIDTTTLFDITESSLALVNDTDWTSGISDPMGKWDLIGGTTATTTIVTTQEGPFGEFPKVMTIAGNNGSPGWYSNWTHLFDTANDESYIAYTWVKRISSATVDGLFFTWEASSVEDLGSPFNTNANPQFIVDQGSIMALNTWHLVVGILHPSDYTGADIGVAGIYQFSDASRIYDGPEFRVRAGYGTSALTLGFFNNAAPNYAPTDGFRYSRPLVYKLDGTEPSVEVVLRRASAAGIGDGVINTAQINADFFVGQTYTGGTFQTRPLLSELSSPFPDTARTSITEAHQIRVQNSSDSDIFGVTDVGGLAQIFVFGDFVAGTLNTAQMYSADGLTDLRGRLGISEPGGGVTGGIAQPALPISLPTSQTDHQILNVSPTHENYNTGLDLNTLSFQIIDSGFRSGSSDNPWTAPTWSLAFFYSDTSSTGPWTAVPGTSSWSITGTTEDTIEDFIPPQYFNWFNLNATRTVQWTPASPFAPDDDIWYIVRVSKTSGDSVDPRLIALSASEPISGLETLSFDTHTVTDTDGSPYTWSATGSAIATTTSEVLTWVSGAGIDIDVDTSLNAIRVTAAGGGTLDGLSDTDLTGAAIGDLLFKSASATWSDTGGKLTWDGVDTLRITESGAGTDYLEIQANATNCNFLSNVNKFTFFPSGAGTSQFTIENTIISVSSGAEFRVTDTGGTDYLKFDHDDTDGNITGVGTTTDLNFTGITNYKFSDSIFIAESAGDNVDAPGFGQFWVRNDATQTPMFTADDSTIIDLTAVSAHAFDLHSDVDLTGATNNDLLYRSGGNWIDSNGVLTFDGTNFNLFQSGKLTIGSSGRSSTAHLSLFGISDPVSPAEGDLWHDSVNNTLKLYSGAGTHDLGAGADITANENITGQWDFQNFVRIQQTGEGLIIAGTANDSTATGWISFEDNAANLYGRIGKVASGDDIRLEATTGNVQIYATAAGGSIILDPSGTGNVNVAGALIATTYGGITEANLVDKSATETISGNWTFSGANIVTGASAEFKFNDNAELRFGTGDDALMVFNGTNLVLGGTASTFELQLGSVSHVKLVCDAPTTTRATFNIPHGSAPTTPVNGDMWSTTGSVFARINGATIDLGQSGGLSDVVQDTSPQLGGDLQSFGADIDMADNDAIFLGTGLDGKLYSNTIDVLLDLGTGSDFRLRGGSTGSESMIVAVADSLVALYYNGIAQFRTQSQTTTGQTSGATLNDHETTPRDIGFNDIKVTDDNPSSVTLGAEHCGASIFADDATGFTITLPASTGLDFPVGGLTTIINANASGGANITVSDTASATLFYLDGTTRTDVVGSCTVGPGGIASLYRPAAAGTTTPAFLIWGTGITP